MPSIGSAFRMPSRSWGSGRPTLPYPPDAPRSTCPVKAIRTSGATSAALNASMMEWRNKSEAIARKTLTFQHHAAETVVPRRG